MSRLLAVGADGARGGWAVACLYEAGTRLLLLGDIGEIARLRADTAAPVAIDIPIGLPEAGGSRACDVAARRLLGRRASTVFAPPARYLLPAAGDYAAMRALVARERQRNPAAKGVSAQSAGIAREVREVDEWVRAHPDSEDWLSECHPELSFLALDAGQPPDREPSRVRARPLHGKRSPAGARRRLQLVSTMFPDAAERIAATPQAGRQAERSDWLDAYAALTAAVAVTRGEHVTLGAARDAEGVPMRIVRPIIQPTSPCAPMRRSRRAG